MHRRGQLAQGGKTGWSRVGLAWRLGAPTEPQPSWQLIRRTSGRPDRFRRHLPEAPTRPDGLDPRAIALFRSAKAECGIPITLGNMRELGLRVLMAFGLELELATPMAAD